MSAPRPRRYRSLLLRLVALLLVSALVFGCGSAGNGNRQLRISAAASTTDVIKELTAEFEARTGFETRADFASSSVLARQIEQGRETDLYFSANRHWVDYLLERDLLTEKQVTRILTNSLAVIGPETSELELSSLEELAKTDGKISMGDPSNVPAGMYGKQALRNAGIWAELEDRVVGAVDTRAALAYVRQQSAPLGIVYTTDARAGKDVKILFKVAEKYTPEINYYLCGLQNSATPKEAFRDFVDYLNSEKAERIFEKHGFSPVK